MKILLDARMYGLEHAGIGRYLVHLTEELKKLNHSKDGRPLGETKEKFVILLRKRYFDSLKFPNNWQKVLADFGHYSFSEQVKLPKILLEQKPDLVHFPHFNIPLFWKGKFVVTIHDMTMHKQGINATNLPLPFYLLKRIPYKILFRKAVKDSVKIITPTESIKDELIDYFDINAKKVVSIHEGFNRTYLGGVDTKNVQKKHSLDGEYFIYTGNVYPHKNIKRAIEAIVSLNKKSKKKVLLAIAGSRNVFLRRTEKHATDLGAEEYVKTLGFVPDKDLVSLYKNSIAFVYPSLSEGFGLQGLEAMATGTLLLASNVPTFKEIYKDNALYFDSRSVPSITKTMEDALRMKKVEREKRIKKAHKFIECYSWAKMAKETLEVYKSAV